MTEEPKKEPKKKKLSKSQALKTQFEELQQDHLRLRADFENYRKRKEQELIETRERAITSFVIDLLPMIDNFEMSLKMTENTDMFIKGVEMIHKNLHETLKENHIQEFEPQEQETFNATEHEPVLIEDPKAQKGVVLETVRKGYKHKENILRPARVKVAKED